ncbi:hypothetical protein BTR22_03500 [Alkalihalophilus pseudofirmus]|uniref:hypothetical protein n=1 Tax=Alkalihalophilus pseudofirmus TaxID=79885 RepID=UPI000952CA02|nr:hypothetical protein BTR22_03500 [Alkalihalophilus pseudofirmus]
MSAKSFIQQSLKLNNMEAIESDIPYIQKVLQAIRKAELTAVIPEDLNEEVPIVIVDPELIQYD